MKRIVILAIGSFLLAGCGPRDDYVPGSLTEQIFTSSYFGFSISFPSQYAVQTDGQAAQGSDIVYELQIGEADSSPLFQFYVQKTDLTGDDEMTEFISQLEAQLRDNDQIQFAVADPAAADLNGVKFTRLSLKFVGALRQVHQDLYLIPKDGYIGTLAVTYIDDDQVAVDDILKTLAPKE